MEEKKQLYDRAIVLLEDINKHLKDDVNLPTINVQMVGVVKNLNDARIRELTGNNLTIVEDLK